MLEILNGTLEDIRKNMDLLAADYLKKTGRKVCRSCPSDIQYMILSLKNIYKMVNFRFKKEAVHYKNKKGDKTTISNNTMTDKIAIEFLKTNPKRIELFSLYPENWETLITSKQETEEELQNRLAIEAEVSAIANAKTNGEADFDGESEEEKLERLNAEGEAKAIAAANGEEPAKAEPKKAPAKKKKRKSTSKRAKK